MKKKKIILWILAVIVLAGAWILFKMVGPATRHQGDGFLYIRTGSTLEDVEKELVGKKILHTSTWFHQAASLVGYKKVKPGKYKVDAGMSVINLARKLNNGQQTPVQLVITKLRTKELLAARVGNLFEFDSLRFISFLNDPDSLKAFNVDTNTVMALAMPYNYEIRWNTTPSVILQQFHAAYQRFWNDERSRKAKDKGFTPMQIMIIASIVEEETRDANDKPKIASTYINRLRKNMLLQADPTVKFALRDFALRRIMFGHLKVQSPYNTYINKGLPPGPICTPSLATIQAVLDAPETEYLYFVASSNFDGTHIFTTNYADHMKYARLFQAELTRRQEAVKP